MAGLRGGFSDERHVWPFWHHLISISRPVVLFGEQVASTAGLGWLDLVHADLEASEYAVGAFDLCAAGVGAPHIRQRLYFVADADGGNAGAEGLQRSGEHGQQQENGRAVLLADSAQQRWRESGTNAGRLAPGDRSQRLTAGSVPGLHVGGHWRNADWIYCRDGKYRPVEPGTFPLAHEAPAREGRLRG